VRRFLIQVAATAALAAAFTALAIVATSHTARRPSGLHAIHVVDVHRHNTWACQRELHQRRSPTRFLERRTRDAGERWTWAAFWGRRERLVCTTVRELNRDPVAAIRYVFMPTGTEAEAIDVSACETGRTFSPRASNGQYLGLFQMGRTARRTCGHGATALQQAFAALCWWREVGGWVNASSGGWSCA
jgi:hypothetical protein